MARYQRNQERSQWNIYQQIENVKKISRNLLYPDNCKNISPNFSDNDPDGFLTHYASNYLIYGSRWASRLLVPELWEKSQAGTEECLDLNQIDELSTGSPIERVSGLVLRGYTNNQLLRDIDAASMTHSLEVRVPYLDPIIADIALSLPDSAKLSNPERISHSSQMTYRSSGAKRILIDVGKNLLPKDFDLQPKRGFGMPFDTWLRGPLSSILEDTLSIRQTRERNWLTFSEVERVKTRFHKGKIGWTKPWLLMMLELWSRDVLDPYREQNHA